MGRSGFGGPDLCIDRRIRKDFTQIHISMMKRTPGYMRFDLLVLRDTCGSIPAWAPGNMRSGDTFGPVCADSSAPAGCDQ